MEINSVLGSTDTTSTTSSTVPPTLGKRDIKTKLSVLDGKTIVVGGLMQNNKTEEETKVPLLGDIPFWAGSSSTRPYRTQRPIFWSS
jgi:type II secretory pathway component GspD/PulD (secretin)